MESSEADRSAVRFYIKMMILPLKMMILPLEAACCLPLTSQMQLGIGSVLPGFSGKVPGQMKRLFPIANMSGDGSPVRNSSFWSILERFRLYFGLYLVYFGLTLVVFDAGAGVGRGHGPAVCEHLNDVPDESGS